MSVITPKILYCKWKCLKIICFDFSEQEAKNIVWGVHLCL